MTGQTLLVALVVGPLLMAAVVAGTAAVRTRRTVTDSLALVTALASLVGAAWLYHDVGRGHAVTWLGGWQPHRDRSVGIVLVADRAAVAMVLLASVLMVAVVVYSWRFVEDEGGTFHALLLVLLGAMTGFACAGDLFNAFVWFELMGVAAYALTGMRIEEPRSVHGALTFGIVNTFGGSLLLLGISFLYARTGELDLAVVGELLRSEPADGLVLVSAALVFGGVLVKAASVPFHFWTADAEAVAPTPVCALLSGALVTVGAYAVARWWWVVFAGVVPEDGVRRALLGLGVASILVGSVMCLAQRHAKRLLAYSTVAHVGVVLCGVGLLHEDGLAGAGLYAVGHAGVLAALFLGTGVLLNRYESVDEHALFGLARGRWLGAAVFALSGAALAGLPPFGPWAGKTLLDEAALKAGADWLVPVLAVPAVLTGGAVLRLTGRVFLGVGERPSTPDERSSHEEPEQEPGARLLPSMAAPGTVLVLLTLLVGVLPSDVTATRVATTMADTTGYAAAVLGRPVPAVPIVPPASPWTAWPLLFGVLTTALALGVAAAAWWPSRFRVATRAHTGLGPVVDALHRVHRAHVGDHIAWVLVGVTALGVLLLSG